MKSVFTITIIALLPIAAFAQTPPATATAATTAASAAPATGMPDHHEKRSEGPGHLSRCGHIAGANCRE